MQDLIKHIVQSLVDEPDKVIIQSTPGRDIIIIEIQTDPSDTGKVIGKGGRIIQAIRVLVNSIAMKNKKRFIVEVLE